MIICFHCCTRVYDFHYSCQTLWACYPKNQPRTVTYRKINTTLRNETLNKDNLNCCSNSSRSVHANKPYQLFPLRREKKKKKKKSTCYDYCLIEDIQLQAILQRITYSSSLRLLAFVAEGQPICHKDFLYWRRRV